MIAVTELSVFYGKNSVLQNLSFSIEKGAFVLITGPTGCGKSTLALALSGLLSHTDGALVRGQVLVDGLDTQQHPIHKLAGKIGIVFQNPSTQLFNACVEEEVAFAPRNLGLPEEEVRRRAGVALESVGITHLSGRLVHTLSTGEKQRLAIASVLSLQPSALVLDEPTANLDWRGVESLVTTLAKLNREHRMTICVIEHRLPAFYPHASRVMILNRGRVVADGVPRKVFADKDRLIALGLRFPWHYMVEGCSHYLPSGIQPPLRRDPPLVRLSGVEAAYGRTKVLSGIDLSIYPGQFTALVGDNGAGKSTLARILAGLMKPKRGKVIWNPSFRRLPMGRRVGFLFQNNFAQLLMDTVEQEAAFAPHNFKLDAHSCVETALKATGLQELRRRAPSTLSVGQQQRAALAAVLSARPALLILDEPTMGQDWLHLSLLMEYLSGWVEAGGSVLLITHDDKLVCRFAERIVHLRERRIAADGLPHHEAQETIQTDILRELQEVSAI